MGPTSQRKGGWEGMGGKERGGKRSGGVAAATHLCYSNYIHHVIWLAVRPKQDLGCEVHAFDHDADHEHYDYRLGPTAFFHKARIGSETGYMRLLDHGGRRLSYLKMDIESEEWSVLSQILHHQNSSATLASTAQLSLEIHIELHGKSLSEKRARIASCLATLEELANLGFKLLTYEENELNPQYEDIDGAHLGLYAEILLLRTNRNSTYINPSN
ncbi:hypothetical protein E2C01_006197 [Portunus trituberculatus]|uniref:Methyltransferase-like protein 24 n=1 Tax=Portunus trituberculatus TaxID=210409 RepID=A0A5B7CX83_PORTR|nr:hypothetical protein [Portunus trituberculatus]